MSFKMKIESMILKNIIDSIFYDYCFLVGGIIILLLSLTSELGSSTFKCSYTFEISKSLPFPDTISILLDLSLIVKSPI